MANWTTEAVFDDGISAEANEEVSYSMTEQ